MGLHEIPWAVDFLLWGLNGWFQSFGAPGGVVAMTAWLLQSGAEPCLRHMEHLAYSIGEGLTFFAVRKPAAWLGWQWVPGPGLIGIITALGVSALLQDTAMQTPRNCHGQSMKE